MILHVSYGVGIVVKKKKQKNKKQQKNKNNNNKTSFEDFYASISSNYVIFYIVIFMIFNSF